MMVPTLAGSHFIKRLDVAWKDVPRFSMASTCFDGMVPALVGCGFVRESTLGFGNRSMIGVADLDSMRKFQYL